VRLVVLEVETETHDSFVGLLADFRLRTRDSKTGGSMLCSAQMVGMDSSKATGSFTIAGIILFKISAAEVDSGVGERRGRSRVVVFGETSYGRGRLSKQVSVLSPGVDRDKNCGLTLCSNSETCKRGSHPRQCCIGGTESDGGR
jgi:hypothetical protein